MPQYWSLEEKSYGTTLILMPGWDMDVAHQFLQFMENGFTPQNHSHFIIDLSCVDHLDSMVIGIIVNMSKRVKKAGGKVALLEPNTRVEKLFADIGLLPYFMVFRDKKNLIQQFSLERTQVGPSL